MPISATTIKGASLTAAQTVLQRRAIQCSFSSVFHIRNANGGASTRDSRRAEKIFTRAVAWPLCCMVLLGGGMVLKRECFGYAEKKQCDKETAQ